MATPTNQDGFVNGFNPDAIKKYAEQNNVTGVSDVSGQLTKAMNAGNHVDLPKESVTDMPKTEIVTENIPQQPQQEAKIDLNAPNSSVQQTQATIVPENKQSVEPKTTQTASSTQKSTEPTQVIDYNVGKGREQDILNNLKEGLANDQAAKSALQNGDYETFKKMYGYDSADHTKRGIIDAFFQTQQPKTSDSFLQMLASGQKIQNQQYRNSPQAAEAQHRYDLIGQYKNASSDVIYSAMVNGTLVPGSEPYNDLLKLNGGVETPAITEAKQKYQQKLISDRLNRDAKIMGGTSEKEVSGTQKVSDDLVSKKGMNYAQEFQKDIVNNAEIVDLSQQVNQKNKEINELESEKKKTIRKIAEAHPGLSTGLLLQIAEEQNASINDRLDQLRNDRDYLDANLKYKTDLASKMFEYKIKQYSDELSYQRDLEKETRTENFQTKRDERNFEQQKELADIQNKYQTSRDVQNYKQDLEKLGITNDMQIDRDKMNFQQQKELASIQNKYQQSRDVQNYQQELDKLKFQYDNNPDYIAKQIANNQSNGLLGLLGNGKVTGYGGAYDGNKGLDVDGKKGDPVFGFNGKVVSIIDANYASSPFGNSVVIEDNNGNQIRLSHLDSINVRPGQTISQTDVIGALGNTGNVIAGKGGDGSHLDIRVKQAGSDTEMSSRQVEQFLKNYNTKSSSPVNKLAEYIIDTQPRGQGFSDADAKAFTESVNKYANAGDTGMVAQLMRNKMLENKQVGDVVYSNADLKAGLKNLRSLLTEYKNSGGNTNVLTNIAETVANKAGTTTSTELAKAKNQLGVLVADYIRAISGTAASDAEVQRLIGNMPQVKNIDSFNMAILDNLENIADNRVKTRIETYLGNNKQYAPELFPEFYGQGTTNIQNNTEYSKYFNN